MTEPMNPVYGSAMFLIGLLLIGAIQNRRRGWRRVRSASKGSEALSPLWEHFEMTASGPVSSVMTPLPASIDAETFSLQLMKLTVGLRGSSKPVTIENGLPVAVEVLRSR